MPYILPKSAGNPLYPYGQAVSFSLQGVPPPASEYISPTDVISVQIDCPVGAASVKLGLRLLSTQGQVVPTLKTYDVAGTGGSGTVDQIQQSEGFLLSIVAEATGCDRGQCFIRVYLQRNQGGDVPIPGEMLIQGYVCDTESLTFPHGTIGSSLDGAGFIRAVSMGALAAGGSCSVTVPAGVRWKLRAITIPTTTTTPAPRNALLLDVTDAAGHLLYGNALVEETSLSTSFTFNSAFMAGGGGLGLAPSSGSLPATAWCPAGSVITVASFDAGGGGPITFGEVFATAEEFVEV